MKPDLPLGDEDVIKMLSQLKDTGPSYPDDLLAQRRKFFQKTLSGIAIGIPLILLIKSSLGNVAWQLVFKVVVISTLAIGTVAGAYIYRDQLGSWLFPTPTATATMPVSLRQATETPTATHMSTINPTTMPTKTIQIISTPKIHPTDSGKHIGQTVTPKP